MTIFWRFDFTPTMMPPTYDVDVTIDDIEFVTQ